MNEWEVSKVTARCAGTGREFAEGDGYYAVLSEGPEGLERRDYSLEAWTGPPEGSFCYWRGRVPAREKKRTAIAIDQTLLLHLFTRLEDDESEAKQQLRFVLALLLMRKRILKFDHSTRADDKEYWQMRLVREQTVHQVVNPQLSDEQINLLSAQLTAILSGDAEIIEALETEGDGGTEPVSTFADTTHDEAASESEDPGATS